MAASSAATLSASSRLSACFAPSCEWPARQVVATSLHSGPRRAFRPVLVVACSNLIHSLHSTLVIAARRCSAQTGGAAPNSGRAAWSNGVAHGGCAQAQHAAKRWQRLQERAEV